MGMGIQGQNRLYHFRDERRPDLERLDTALYLTRDDVSKIDEICNTEATKDRMIDLYLKDEAGNEYDAVMVVEVMERRGNNAICRGAFESDATRRVIAIFHKDKPTSDGVRSIPKFMADVRPEKTT